MKEILLINPENVSEQEAKNYPVREAARAIVLDSENNIALLYVGNKNYYKLPGGGLEGDEDKMIALQRECEEEIGCNVEVTGEVGMIVEYRKFCTLKQISYCYLAKVKGEKGRPNFTGEEVTDNFSELWVPLEKALELMQTSQAVDLEGKSYITPRDVALLREAHSLIVAQ
jgi:ADP-ribose pyrophosphatase YjhB (NUDIX family)